MTDTERLLVETLVHDLFDKGAHWELIEEPLGYRLMLDHTPDPVTRKRIKELQKPLSEYILEQFERTYCEHSFPA